MAYSPSEKFSPSYPNARLGLPGSPDVRQRRMTMPSLPPPAPLNLPEPVYGHRRPPSPLRHSSTIDPATGEISDDGGSTHESERSRESRSRGRAHSPNPSVVQFAANIAQRVGSLVNSTMSPHSSHNGLPTDDELEAEAVRERERSRKEAERIMRQEAEERREMEERVMALLQADSGSPGRLPPPTRAQTMPVTPPSPQSSQKESSWWTTAKNKLTPTKEPLTPAQQIIQDAKARDKEQEKDKKKKSAKSRQKSKDSTTSTSWPAVPEAKFDDPSFTQLGLTAPSRPVSTTPSSPKTPFLGSIAMPSTPPSLAASPLRSTDAGGSPARAATPVYAQFNVQGTLDVPGTLLTVVKRFEKLEKWTVSHVRALEERMDDVERWLVEKERDRDQSPSKKSEHEGTMSEVREELAELQGRVGELGREMAKLLTAPGNLSNGPSRSSAAIGRAPSTTSIAVRSISHNMTISPTSTPPRVTGSTSPPVTTPAVPSRTSRTRLPYPTGDYASPPETGVLGQSPFSPTNSPPSSITSATKHRQMSTSISGLPSQTLPPMDTSPSGLPRVSSPTATSSIPSLPPPPPLDTRRSSISPTPRKRYTVALGGPIMSVDRDRDRERPATPHSRSQSRELSTAFFSTSPLSLSSDTLDDSDGANDETIGKAASKHFNLAPPPPAGDDSRAEPSPSPTPSDVPSQRRPRPQTMYGSQFSSTNSNIAAPSPVTPLSIRLRSRSTDRLGLGISDASGAPITPSSTKFVDPLVVRRQTKEVVAHTVTNPPKAMTGKPKVPVGQLVAFFDKEKAS